MAIGRATLRHFSFFKPLDDYELKRLAPHIGERRYAAGELIFEEGVPGQALYLVRAGRVLIFTNTPEGETPLNEMQVGDAFGEMSLLDDRPRSAAARAIVDSVLLEIPREQFVALVRRFPVLLAQAARDSSDRLRRSNGLWIRELETRNRQLVKLYETSLAISRHLELQTALVDIAERARELLGGVDANLYMIDPASNHLVPVKPGPPAHPGRGVIGRVLSCAGAEFENRSRHSRTARSTLAAAICLDGQPVGVLTVYRLPSQEPFVTQDAQLLLLLANQAAITVENARLHRTAVDKARLDGELHAAYQVQASLLPLHDPQIPGFQVATLWRPARQVSGDFYDFIPLPDRRWGIVIADVSDKGMAAALMMAASRSILRASVTGGLDAAAAVAHANRVLCADATNDMFITLFLALVDSRSRTLSYVNAGHNPPLLLRARTRKIEQLTRTTLPVGVDENAVVRSCEVQLEPDDVLTLYTDGVTEADNGANELFGDERLVALVTRFGPAGAQPLVRAIDKQITDFTGNRPLADDVTVVILHARKSRG